MEQTTDTENFPPSGWVTADQAARIVGISRTAWKRLRMEGGIGGGKLFAPPGGGRARHKLYPVQEIERLLRERRDAPTLVLEPDGAGEYRAPQGYVDWRGACAMLKASPSALTVWQRQGKIAVARWGSTHQNKRYRLFAVADLQRFLEHKRAETVFVEPAAAGTPATYHVPEGYVRADKAADMFGVSRKTLRRWEAEGRITCGTRELGAKLKVYPVDELRRLVAECGTLSASPYEDPDRAGVWRVPLAGHGMRRKEALVDAADVALVEGKRCHFSAQGPDHESDTVVVVAGGEWRNLRTLVMGVSGRGLRVSHRNGDALDCRRANLIVRTPQALSRGYGKQTAYGGRTCSSRFKGVCFDKQTGKWRASIVVDYQTIQLGRHGDEIAAAQAYDEAAHELFGEHARLNFPDGVDAWLEAEAQRTERAQAA